MDDAGAEPARVTARSVPPFSVVGSRLAAFPAGDDGYPIILKIERGPYLVALQRMIYNQMIRQGCECSQYSVPERYQPHVTLAYAEQGIGESALRRPVTVACDRFLLTRDEYKVERSYPLARAVRTVNRG